MRKPPIKNTYYVSDPGLPLASLRLLVPPLQLLSAAMWQLAKQKDVMNYDKLQEFVFMVTEAVPGLINHRQRAQLILGLRARLVLEWCKGSDRGSVDSQLIQNYLEQLPITSDSSDAEVKTIEYTFIALVQSLLKDPAERAYFFQEIFPVEYGTQYDAALLVLMWEFLSKLEKMLPVPDLKQTAAWLASTPSALEECVQSSPAELSLIFQQFMNAGMLKIPHGPSSNIGSCIMSALSIPPSQKPNISVGLGSIHSYASIISDQYSIVAVYTEEEAEGDGAVFESAEVQVHADFCENEIVTVTLEDAAVQECVGSSVEATGEAVDVAKALETLTRTFALRKENISQDGLTGKNSDAANDENTNDQLEICFHAEDLSEATEEVKGDSTAPEDPESQLISSVTEFTDNYESPTQEKVTDDDSDAPASESRETSSPVNIRRSSRLKVKTSHGWQEVQTCKRTAKEVQLSLPELSENAMNKEGVSVAPTVIAIKGLDKGDSEETTSIIFTCSQCPFHSSPANSPPHFHMQSIPTEEYKALSGAKVTPSPCSTDEIFTSIKLFPKESQQQIRAQVSDDNKSPADVAEPQDKHKGLICETCGKTFTRTSDVRRHQLTHTGERPFHCSQCERTFQHSWDLAKHESKDHGVPISFSCPLCRSSFTSGTLVVLDDLWLKSDWMIFKLRCGILLLYLLTETPSFKEDHVKWVGG
uniref:Zinc finger protein 252-like n=1 Tax=Cynoglossus semilaevis TaxID=244447 RepID=A0A3P8V563_CYNSE